MCSIWKWWISYKYTYVHRSLAIFFAVESPPLRNAQFRTWHPIVAWIILCLFLLSCWTCFRCCFKVVIVPSVHEDGIWVGKRNWNKFVDLIVTGDSFFVVYVIEPVSLCGGALKSDLLYQLCLHVYVLNAQPFFCVNTILVGIQYRVYTLYSHNTRIYMACYYCVNDHYGKLWTKLWIIVNMQSWWSIYLTVGIQTFIKKKSRRQNTDRLVP